MSELAPELRNQLARVIVKARTVAETGARKALKSLAVERHEPHSSMSPDERTLRNRLRARGRQLGDVRDRQRGSQSIEKLVHEVAYEHWHRMLFARFLSESGLLIHPEHNVSMSSAEIEELARETGEDPHQMAARFAQESLPQIFRADDPVLEITLAPESRQSLESLLDKLPSESYTADDSLGWTYQYWQAEKKDAVNASGEKIGADELPAVTQLFTEHYMVMFLFHNTLGAWHAGKVLTENPDIAASAVSEEELRRAVALKTDAGDSNWDYLRFVRDHQEGDQDDNPTGPWRPAAGIFEGWPRTAKELKVFDPCCGSGHFLVAGFKLLTRLRILEEGLALEDAINAVLQENLYGLELDPRCTQIAAFNLALAAWRWVGRPNELPSINLACSGLSIGSSKRSWLGLAGHDEQLQAGLADLHELFRQAPVLGSLIDPKSLGPDLFVAGFEKLQPLLQTALAEESADEETVERAFAAQGMAKAVELLAHTYTLVVTNVPFLGRGQQAKMLQDYAVKYYALGKADLATIFILRLVKFLEPFGTISIVSPSNWLSLTSYKTLRRELLEQLDWNSVTQLGPGAFQTISGHVVNVAFFIASRQPPSRTSTFVGIDVSKDRSPMEKSRALRDFVMEPSEGGQPLRSIRVIRQLDQLQNPDARINLHASSDLPILSKYANASHGIGTFDSQRFRFYFWEVDHDTKTWAYQQTSPARTQHWSGCLYKLRWEDGRGDLAALMAGWEHEGYSSGKWRAGVSQWGHPGVVVGQMGDFPSSLYVGYAFDENASVLTPRDPCDISAIWAFVSSSRFRKLLRSIDSSIKVTCKTLVKVPIDIEYWRREAAVQYQQGLPQPLSNDPTQWLFHGNPSGADKASVLHVAVGRLLGYRWPPEEDDNLSLDREANQLVEHCRDLDRFSDGDGIVCLSAIRSEAAAADRLRRILSSTFSAGWSVSKEQELLAASVGNGKQPPKSIEIWLRDKFFEEHCRLFNQRPYIWHIWDGHRDGFHCMINAHKLLGPDGEARRTLEAVAYSYLGDWIQRQKNDREADTEGADARLVAALDLQTQLENILKGEPPYDLFVRWKPLHRQAIGWDPDIRDGIRLNIRPFMSAELRKGGKKGAGILRSKPNIKWNKDRGKEPESLRPIEEFPWFWGCNGNGNDTERTDYTPERANSASFDGNRWNDLHYSRSVKEAARETAKRRDGGSTDS